jgi:CDP-paratose 2-epimerase
LNTTVVRQSCIYGLYQKGTEDQGWVAWFIKQFLKNNKVTIYGNGKQVRDILYIDDLVDFYELLVSSDTKGEIFNMGGGHKNKVSLIEFINILKSEMKGNTISYDFDLQRPGDQKIFVSDNSKAESLGWSPKTNKYDGIKKLIEHYKS